MPARPSARRPSTRLTLALLTALVSTGLAGVPATAAPRPAPFRATCPTIFPATNVWNRRVDTLPVRSNSATLIASIGSTTGVHPDFGTYAGYGIPINVVTKTTTRSSVDFWWPDESDAGPYPIPASPKIEGFGDGDAHLLMLDRTTCRLFELYAASHDGAGWHAGSGAIWDLSSNALRPDGWTSADAAGLPITPGLARYDEVAGGAIAHALRFTVPSTRQAHIYPARHDAGSGTSSSLPPMGLRLRLKANVSLAGFGPQARVILTALKRYGMILADNGSAIYISGESNPGWDDDDLHELNKIKGSMFEVVDTTGFVNG
jgi:hypothetical protein